MNTISAMDVKLEDYHEIIDVRAPVEYAEDHIPGAINLPVLNDEERARVGTIYKQESVFEARKIGAALVSSNIAMHLQTYLAKQAGGYRPLIYCWRGGQRSRSMALIFTQIGWPQTLLEGGYKAFRKKVLREFPSLCTSFEYRVLSGLTGTGKTEILHELRAKGEQVLDLEGLANHRGSLLGAPEGGQNCSQKRFETRLWNALRGMDTKRPIWTEAESAKIGEVFCPKPLLTMLRGSIRIELQVSMEERAAYLCDRYPQWRKDPEALLERLKWVGKKQGQAEWEQWTRLAKEGHWSQFVTRLLEKHYDPSYQSALDKADGEGAYLKAGDLLGEGCQKAAAELLASLLER